MLGQMDTRASLVADGLDIEALSDLKAAVKGEVILPGDKAYESARHLWNARVDKRPAIVVRPIEPMDVASAVAFARQQELPLSVRGGGHNPSGIAIANGGLVIDLRRMRNVSVDPIQRTALAQGGAAWDEVDRLTQAFGLATTGTDVSTVGIGGSTLGGGHGWLGRLLGLTIEAVAERFAIMPSPRSIGILWHPGGAISRVAPEATAYYHRGAQYHFRSISTWAGPSEAEANLQWSLETYAALKDYYGGKVYVNHLDADDAEKRVREAYGGNYDRLVALKNRYDPTNLFSSNFNIRPTL